MICPVAFATRNQKIIAWLFATRSWDCTCSGAPAKAEAQAEVPHHPSQYRMLHKFLTLASRIIFISHDVHHPMTSYDEVPRHHEGLPQCKGRGEFRPLIYSSDTGMTCFNLSILNKYDYDFVSHCIANRCIDKALKQNILTREGFWLSISSPPGLGIAWTGDEQASTRRKTSSFKYCPYIARFASQNDWGDMWHCHLISMIHIRSCWGGQGGRILILSPGILLTMPECCLPSESRCYSKTMQNWANLELICWMDWYPIDPYSL